MTIESESLSFASQLLAFENRTIRRGERFTTALVLKLGERIVLRTPVDTGRARANWQYGKGVAPSGEVQSVSKSGAEAIAAIRGKIDPTPGVHFVMNNLDYIKGLERGKSQRQAPHGMVAVTVVEFQGLVGQAIIEIQR